MQKSGMIHKLDSLFILLIFSVFAVVSLLLVAIGAGMYRRVVERMGINEEVRSSLSYVVNKVRANDEAGALSLKTYGGVPVLCMKQSGEDSGLTNYVYFYNGEIRELLSFDDEGFQPENGDAIVAADNFTMEAQGGLYTFTVTDSSGKTTSISLCERSGSLR